MYIWTAKIKSKAKKMKSKIEKQIWINIRKREDSLLINSPDSPKTNHILIYSR